MSKNIFSDLKDTEDVEVFESTTVDDEFVYYKQEISFSFPMPLINEVIDVTS